jgi:hypothetical protein
LQFSCEGADARKSELGRSLPLQMTKRIGLF